MMKRTQRHTFTTDMRPADPEASGFTARIKEVVDCISTADQEATLNKLLGKGNNWCADGTYIKHTDAIQIAYGEYIGGDCFLKSLECYWRLRSAGAKRVCGRRTAIAGVDTDDNPHYWVENKDLVFDCGGGQQKIYKKAKFYELMKIEGAIEGNEMGCFRKDKLEIELEKKCRLILADFGIPTLAEFIKNTNWSQNMEAFNRIKASKKKIKKFVKVTHSFDTL